MAARTLPMARGTSCLVCRGAACDASLPSCTHRFCRACLYGYWERRGALQCPVCATPVACHVRLEDASGWKEPGVRRETPVRPLPDRVCSEERGNINTQKQQEKQNSKVKIKTEDIEEEIHPSFYRSSIVKQEVKLDNSALKVRIVFGTLSVDVFSER
ncbi:hypothetical protein Z043_115117 [Scleropages formosus]|uniref:RING-type domain-containing protein n=1 Tax=Scleropages formosus TaxID=113540 RepID=A0A0P7U8U5_SCLFO|nr:hypothetical protein Z043_115117 [Scleropages formosus]